MRVPGLLLIQSAPVGVLILHWHLAQGPQCGLCKHLAGCGAGLARRQERLGCILALIQLQQAHDGALSSYLGGAGDIGQEVADGGHQVRQVWLQDVQV